MTGWARSWCRHRASSECRLIPATRSRSAASWLATVLPRACCSLDTRAYRAMRGSGTLIPPHRWCGALAGLRLPGRPWTSAGGRHEALVGLGQASPADPRRLERRPDRQGSGTAAVIHRRLLQGRLADRAASVGSAGPARSPPGSAAATARARPPPSSRRRCWQDCRGRQAVLVGEDAHHVGTALDLLVEPLEWVGNRYEVCGADVSLRLLGAAAYAASIRDRGSGSTMVRAGRCIG